MRRLLPILRSLSALAVLPACAPTQPPVSPEPPSIPSWASTPALEVPTLCQSGESESWRLSNGVGGVVAVSTGACLGREVRGYHLLSQVRAASNTETSQRPEREVHVWIREDGTLTHAQVRTPSWTERYRYGGGTTRVTRHGDVTTLEGTVLPNLDHDLFLQEVAFRCALASSVAPLRWRGANPTEDMIERGFDATTPVGAPLPVDATRTWTLDGDQRAAARIARVTDVNGAVVATRDDSVVPTTPLPETPRPTYTPSEDLEIVAIEIPGANGKPSLAAELVLPRSRRDPLPVVVFFSGSGPQNRLGFVPGTSIDVGSHEIHDRLAAAGFAVLRFDDRGVGDSELGNTATPGYLALVDDARRAVQVASDHAATDPRRVILMGHSLGALTALLLANERSGRARARPHALVLLAGAGRNLREVIYDQVRANYEDPADQTRAVEDARKIHVEVMRDGPLPAASEPARMWMKEVFAYDPAAVLRTVRAPVLVVQGSKDFQVHPEHDFMALKNALNRHRSSTARRFDDLDHLFKPEPGASSVGHYGDLSRRVDPTFLEFVSTWVRDVAD